MKKIKLISLSIIISAVTIGSLYFGTLIFVPKFADLNKYKESISQEIENQTGFKVSCENITFKKSLSPYFKINMYHTIVLYPDDEIFLKLKEIDLKIKVLPLLIRKISVKDAKFTRPIINIKLYKDFSTSIEKYINTNEKINSKGFSMNSIIKDTVLENYKVNIIDESINKNFYLQGDKLVFKNIKIGENAYIILQGALFENEKKYINYDVELKTILTNEKTHFIFSPFKTISEYSVNGNLNGKLDISKNNRLFGNLNINDLSVNIENTKLANNNIKLIFKGEEADIKSELHTSKTDIAKIFGKFNFGKKKYIDIDVNAQNLNLENLSKIISVTAESFNVKNQIKDIQMKGTANADFSLSSDFKKLKSKGNAQIINAKIFIKDLPYKIEKINSDINFDNNKILVEKAHLLLNNTPINLSGQINEDVSVNINASSENLDLKAVSNIFLKPDTLPVKILKGKVSFNSIITGKIDKTLKSENKIILSNVFIEEKAQKIPLKVENININLTTNKQKYSGEVQCTNLISPSKKIFDLSSENFVFKFDDKEIKFPQNKIILGKNSQINFDGTVKNYVNLPEMNIKFDGNLISQETAQFISLYIKEPYKAVGEVKTKGTFTLKDGISKIKAQLFADKDNYISYLVIRELLNKPSISNIDAEINGKEITLKDISLKENNADTKNKILTITGMLINENTPLFKNLRLQIPNSLTACTNFMGGEEISLNGDLTLNNTLNAPLITGIAKIHKYNIKNYLTSIQNADVVFSKDNIKITAPDITVNNSKLNAVIDVLPSFKDKITVNLIQLNCLNLDLNNFFDLLEKERNPLAKTIITVKKGIATINTFKVLDLKAQDISSDFSIENNTLKIGNISAKAYGGNISGDINYELPSNLLEIKMNGRNVDMKNSLYDLCKLNDNIEGRSDFKSDISLIPQELNQALKSIKGNVEFNAYNGKMGSLGKFEYYLSAKNIFYHGFLNTTLNRVADVIHKDKTENFKSSNGTLKFQNGYMIMEEVTTQGKNMSLYLNGRHNLLTNESNIDIYGRISDEIRKKLGSFGDVSLSEIINGQTNSKNIQVQRIPYTIINKIPALYNQTTEKTNTFRVNIYGNIEALNAINSFDWVVSDKIETEAIESSINSETTNTQEPPNSESQTNIDLPDFMEINKNE